MKRRILLSVGVLMLLSATAGAGGIDARSTAGPANDFVLASFVDQYATHYFINAWSGPAGGKARGSFETSISFFRGNVDCLAVHRHEALVIADNREHRFVVTFLLRDNRHGPDELLFVDVRQGSSPRQCPPFDGTDGYPGTPVSGVINVHDAREP
jgi:hypothetical protein